jgi:hypothetical protein
MVIKLKLVSIFSLNLKVLKKSDVNKDLNVKKNPFKDVNISIDFL